MDAVLLADAGMQLAEGERILLRPHKTFPADDILGLAVKVAAEKKDKATLDRLAKIAEKRENAALKDQVAAAQKLAGSQSRAIDSALIVSLDEITPEQFLVYQELVRELQRARILGDREAIEKLEKAIKDVTWLPAKQHDHLLKVVSESLAAMPKASVADPMTKGATHVADRKQGGSEEACLNSAASNCCTPDRWVSPDR